MDVPEAGRAELVDLNVIAAATGYAVNPSGADRPSLPPGVKVAVIEGPLNEAVPFNLRLKLPANYEIPAHWHPWIEHATVISGSLNMGIGDKLNRYVACW